MKKILAVMIVSCLFLSSLSAQERQPIPTEPMTSIDVRPTGQMSYKGESLNVFSLGNVVSPVPEAKSRHGSGMFLFGLGIAGGVIGGGIALANLVNPPDPSEPRTPKLITFTSVLLVSLGVSVIGNIVAGSSAGVYNDYVKKHNETLEPSASPESPVSP